MKIGVRAPALLALILTACLAACSPPATPTPTPAPTAAPTATPVLATSASQFIGTWHGIKADGMYERFTADGILQTAGTLEGLANPDAECTYRFEGTRLTIKELKATGLPPCGTKEGVYEVELLASGAIRFRRISDACVPRGRTMAQEHEPVR